MAAVDRDAERGAAAALMAALGALYEAEAALSDLSRPEAHEVLAARLKDLIPTLSQLRERGGALAGVQLPAALVRHIDEGGHPDDFVRQAFTTAAADQQLAAGRVAALEELRTQLAARAAKAFPAAAAAYEEVVSAKQAQQEDGGHVAG